MADYQTDVLFHYELLEVLARRLKPTLYVELGIGSGHCIHRVAPYCDRAIGVDIVPPERAGGFEFFQGTTQAFAAKMLPDLEPIELAFIDADHRHSASVQDFESMLPYMAEDGLVLLHDTYPENADWLAEDLCSDSYRTAEFIALRGHIFGVESCTLPSPPGLTLVRKRSQHLAWQESPLALASLRGEGHVFRAD